MLASSNFQKTKSVTPMRPKIKQQEAPLETPECYTKVTLETPKHIKMKKFKAKSDQIRNLTVAIRVRPMNNRERHNKSTNVVKAMEQTIYIDSIPFSSSSAKMDYAFPYDIVFWSCNETDLNYADQEDVFYGIGQPLLYNAFRGYNACLFAYGQTGSGKTYSMMGSDVENIDCDINAGIIPRFCKELFNRVAQLQSQKATVSVSYFEIYNEKIHDLLSNATGSERIPLKVREHPIWGPYVVNLSSYTVTSYEDLQAWLLLGNKNRVTAATVMNEKSSRSHSIFSIELSLIDTTTKTDLARTSKVSLIDLAGSERSGNIHTSEERLKQGVCINKSLLTLGKVISALADQKKGSQFVPYRESVLTWLLRESLGGNSLTSMLATITPASTSIDETLATLRYACQARSIINRAYVNEDPQDRVIRELRSEVERLQALHNEQERSSLLSSSLPINNSHEFLQELEDLRCKLNKKEEELKKAEQEWGDKYRQTHQQQLQYLAEVNREKEELESRVRIMSNLEEDLNLIPYQTNFLEEVENLLLHNETEIDGLLKTFITLLYNCGYDYGVSLNDSRSIINIFDNKNQKTTCTVGQIRTAINEDEIPAFIKQLKWETTEDKLNEADIDSAMKNIYDNAKILQSHIKKSEKLNLAFAQFIKATQKLETTLYKTINVNKTKKKSYL